MLVGRWFAAVASISFAALAFVRYFAYFYFHVSMRVLCPRPPCFVSHGHAPLGVFPIFFFKFAKESECVSKRFWNIPFRLENKNGSTAQPPNLLLMLMN
jgi:hypothetical protein